MLRTILFPPLPSSTTPAIDAELDLLLRCADFCDAAYYINEKDKNDPFHESPKLKQQYKINDFKNWDRHGNRAISFTTKKENVDISSMFVDDKFPPNTTVVVVAFRGKATKKRYCIVEWLSEIKHRMEVERHQTPGTRYSLK